MIERPRSVTIVSWFLIIASLISIVSTTLTLGNPDVVKMMELNAMPLTLQYILMAIGLAITIACGVLMLKGKRLGRTVYVGWTVISLIIGLFTAPAIAALIPGVIFFVVIAFFLFRPKANDYFAGSRMEPVSGS